MYYRNKALLNQFQLQLFYTILVFNRLIKYRISFQSARYTFRMHLGTSRGETYVRLVFKTWFLPYFFFNYFIYRLIISLIHGIFLWKAWIRLLPNMKLNDFVFLIYFPSGIKFYFLHTIFVYQQWCSHFLFQFFFTLKNWKEMLDITWPFFCL